MEGVAAGHDGEAMTTLDGLKSAAADYLRLDIGDEDIIAMLENFCETCKPQELEPLCQLLCGKPLEK
jgi:hypothetical protein